MSNYDASARLKEFRALRGRGALCTTVTEQLATEAATGFMEAFETKGEYLSDAITLLAEISTLEEPCLAQPGTKATFPLLIERLSDSFNPQLCRVYDRAFAHMIAICRKLPAGSQLDAKLRAFGLVDEPTMLARKAGLRNAPRMQDSVARESVRRVLILSRVTLGADIAIGSVILQCAKAAFPHAELVIVGSPKLHQLFGGDAGIRVRELRYRSEGGLLDRLQSWFPVMGAIEEETRQLRPEEFVVLDPDSRLLQLGLLPPLHDESRYFFLESRAFGEAGQGSMSRIARDWMANLFGASDGEVFPLVSIRKQDRTFGAELCRKLRAAGSGMLVSASFGDGGNTEKRLPEPFEQELLDSLLNSGSTVLLDSGFNDEEVARAETLAKTIQSRGGTAIRANADNAPALLNTDTLRCELLLWQGEIGAFAGLIGASDEYVGYDSSGQHIAAALGIPVIDIFTRPPSPVFVERWMPTGESSVNVVVKEPWGETPLDPTEVMSSVLALHNATVSTRRHHR
jgi:ADP-heptose:LPS heptosyltransferase